MSNKLPPFTSEYVDKVPNVIDSVLKNNTEYVSSIAIAKRGKHPIIAKSITTVDIPTSEVLVDWEARNDKAITLPRPKGDEPVGDYVRASLDIPADYDFNAGEETPLLFSDIVNIENSYVTKDKMKLDLKSLEYDGNITHNFAFKIESNIEVDEETNTYPCFWYGSRSDIVEGELPPNTISTWITDDGIFAIEEVQPNIHVDEIEDLVMFIAFSSFDSETQEETILATKIYDLELILEEPEDNGNTM